MRSKEPQYCPETTSRLPNHASAISRRLAILSMLTLSVGGCSQKKEEDNTLIEDIRSSTSSLITPESVECLNSSEFAEEDRKLQEGCDEYPNPTCNIPFKVCGDGVREARIGFLNRAKRCFIPKKPESPGEAPLYENIYAGLTHAWQLNPNYDDTPPESYAPALCNPYELNANPYLHLFMRARFLSLHPEMIDHRFDKTLPWDQIKAFDSQKDNAFGSLRTNFIEYRSKCIAWDRDPKHKLLPTACLLALDKKEK